MLNVAMNQLGTVYATKRRRRNGKTIKPPPKDGVVKSNPSKRHRERLNSELDTLASLLPFEQNILSKLDRLSILRLAVAYLRTKNHFFRSMLRDKDDVVDYRNRDHIALTAYDHTPLDGEMFLQALNGFLLMISCDDGELFFTTHNIECYLGMHQSDIVHQSIWEMVHSEDREELQRQLMWNAFLPSELSGMTLPEAIHTPEHANFLERSFTVRFRCLLDNTSGFLRLDIRGRVRILHGQNRKSGEEPMALFALCTPFGPPTLLETPQKEVTINSKHKLDLGILSMDHRGKMLLGYSDAELTNMGGYDLVHFDDLAYVASAHQELLKTGRSCLIAYRLQSKDGQWKWLQTTSKLIYKNSKPDFIVSCHKPLMEEEGRDLLGKRTMDFKVSYLDAGLTYFSDQDSTAVTSMQTPPTLPPKSRRYKTQLRDFLATNRSKRKIQAGTEFPLEPTTAPPTVVGPTTIQHIQQAAYSTPYNCSVYGSTYATPDSNLYVQQQNFYHHPANFDNRYLDGTSLFQYRALGTYYPEYGSTYVGNGFLDVSRGCIYDNQYGKDAGCTGQLEFKTGQLDYKNSQHSYANIQQSLEVHASSKPPKGSGGSNGLDPSASSSPGGHEVKSSTEVKREEYMMHYANGGSDSAAQRQTVLMWGPSTAPLSRHSAAVITPQSMYPERKYCPSGDPLRSLEVMNPATPVTSSGDHKWGVGTIIKSSLGDPMGSNGHVSTPLHHTIEHHGGSTTTVTAQSLDTSSAIAAAKYLQSYHHPGSVTMSMGSGVEQGSGSELFGGRYLLPYGDKSDRSPLLSISEVTNTLLNHSD